MEDQYKLFIWRGVANDWAEGSAFAFAQTVEQARELLLKQFYLPSQEADRKKIMGDPDETHTEPYIEIMPGSQ